MNHILNRGYKRLEYDKHFEEIKMSYTNAFILLKSSKSIFTAMFLRCLNLYDIHEIKTIGIYLVIFISSHACYPCGIFGDKFLQKHNVFT